MNYHAISEFVHSHSGWVILMAAITVLGCLERVRSRFVVRRWATKNEFKLLKYKQLWFGVGPFFYKRTSSNQTVYSVTVRDRQGNDKSGWVRVGGWWWGALFSDEADVIWVSD